MRTAASRRRAVEELRGRDHDITGEHLKHLSPLGWESTALTGVHRWELGDAPRRGDQSKLGQK